MRLSERMQRIAESATMSVTARAQQLKAEGRDVLSFSAGEPDFDTPACAAQGGIEAIRAGHTRYTPVAGLPALRQAVADLHNRALGTSYDPASVMVSAGGKQAIANVLLAAVGPGDEVVFTSPYWVSYPDQVALAGGESVVVETDPGRGFVPDPQRIGAAIGPRTRMVILNSPANPTGAVYPRSFWDGMASVLSGTDVLLLSDEIYGRLVYGGARHVSPGSLGEELSARTVIVDGMSKTFAMTGWRLGWAVGPEELIRAAGKIQSHTTSNASSISQHAALRALAEGDPDFDAKVAEYDRRRRFMVERLRGIEGVDCPEPLGAFYAFPRVSSFYGRALDRKGDPVVDSVSFCEACLEAVGVAVVPGKAFGADAHVRFSYATSMERIEKGLERFAEFLGRLR